LANAAVRLLRPDGGAAPQERGSIDQAGRKGLDARRGSNRGGSSGFLSRLRDTLADASCAQPAGKDMPETLRNPSLPCWTAHGASTLPPGL